MKITNEKNNLKGITLISLVITIVILVILANITIVTLKNSSLFSKSKDAVDNYTISQKSEKNILNDYENEITQEGNGGYYINPYKENAWDFDYTGNEQIFKVPASGIYQLETWGAQGGGTAYIGGYGGYSTGKIYLNKGISLYINVGGKGVTAAGMYGRSAGGYNGGGRGRRDGNVGGGGGATHIATVSGILSSLASQKGNIIIVSGGGGGSLDLAGPGYAGGGIKGNGIYGGNQTTATTGSNTETPGFGYGASAYYNGAAAGGAGGGYYGGGSSHDTAGSGGSGYIGNSLLSDKHMVGYNVETSNDESTKTLSTTNASEVPTSNYAKIGNGYARITCIE